MSDKAQPDTIYGIEAIAEHVGMTARQAKYRADIGQMPSFKMGRTVCASRAALNGWLASLAVVRKVVA